MNKLPAVLSLNGQKYSAPALSKLIEQKLSAPGLPEWEAELFAFLKEWFSPSGTICAQTSGSTGAPSTIELPKSVMIESALRTIEYFGLREENRILLSLPCRFIAGKMMIVRAIVGRMELVDVDPSSDFDFLLTHRFDFGAMVTNQVYKLLGSENGKQKLENISNLLIGGSAISAHLEAQISQLNNRVVSTYGMTETASHIAIRELSGKMKSDLYHCLPGISVSLNKNDCLQIQVSGFSEPLSTTDIAEIISPTTFRILGRADEVIISGGIKYWPQTIEKKLEPLIANRFVISALPDEKLGEKLVLVIEGKPHDMQSRAQKISESLSSYERPKSICFLETFPQTPTGKLKRNEIKQLIQNTD